MGPESARGPESPAAVPESAALVESFPASVGGPASAPDFTPLLESSEPASAPVSVAV